MNLIESLKGKARDWANVVVDLYNTPVPKEMAKEKEELLAYAKRVKETVERAVPGAFEANEEFSQMNLGLAPLVIPAVVIAGAVAAMTHSVLKFKRFIIKANMASQLRAEGVSNEDILRLLDATENKLDFSGKILNKVILPIGGLLIAYQFLK